ncbi:MAG: hypothetical protein ACI83Q_000193 [Colwellia polaris]
MKKTTILLTLVLFTGLTTAQSANETQQALQQAESDIQLMEEEDIPTERVTNLLETANNSYLAQRNFENEGGTADYSRVKELTQQISDIQERAIRVSDRISALDMRLKELENTSVNLSSAENELNAAKDDFQSQRFEEAEGHVESGYSAISEAQSARTQVESFAAAQQEDIVAQINIFIDYLRANPTKVGGSTALGLLAMISFWKEFNTYRLIKRRKRKTVKEEVLERLITDSQKEYYMRKEGSPIQFNTKMNRFEDLRRNVVEDIEIIDGKLENRHSLLFDPEEPTQEEVEIDETIEESAETEKEEQVKKEQEQQKPVEVIDTEDETEDQTEEVSESSKNEEQEEAEDTQDMDNEESEDKEEESEENNELVCDECGEEFETERGLSIHRERTHDSEIQAEGVVCPVCGDVFDTERGMHIHRGEVHKD